MENKKNIKALILSGGGIKGTFQYGAKTMEHRNERIN